MKDTSARKIVRIITSLSLAALGIFMMIGLISRWDYYAIGALGVSFAVIGIVLIFSYPRPTGEKREKMIKDSEALVFFGLLCQQRKSSESLNKSIKEKR